MNQFKDYAYYYDLFYKDKDYHGEAAVINTALKKYGVSGNKIISFGCATGRHERELSALGYKVHGIDYSKDMIDIATDNTKQRVREEDRISPTFEVADICSYKSEKTYDACISLFQVMSYQTSNEKIINAFKSARSLLPPPRLSFR